MDHITISGLRFLLITQCVPQQHCICELRGFIIPLNDLYEDALKSFRANNKKRIYNFKIIFIFQHNLPYD
jgi:hypothetical protein